MAAERLNRVLKRMPPRPIPPDAPRGGAGWASADSELDLSGRFGVRKEAKVIALEGVKDLRITACMRLVAWPPSRWRCDDLVAAAALHSRSWTQQVMLCSAFWILVVAVVMAAQLLLVSEVGAKVRCQG